MVVMCLFVSSPTKRVPAWEKVLSVRILHNFLHKILNAASVSPPECPEKCVRGACTADGECCHPQCLGSCTVPGSDTACAACVHYYYQGRCVADCPPGTYKFEGWRCISAELCSKVHLPDLDSFIIHGGECMSECPSGYTRTAPNR